MRLVVTIHKNVQTYPGTKRFWIAILSAEFQCGKANLVDCGSAEGQERMRAVDLN